MKPRTISDDCGSAAFQLGHYAGLHWRDYAREELKRASKATSKETTQYWERYVAWIAAQSALRIFLKTVTSREGRDQKRRQEIRKRAGEGFRAGKADDELGLLRNAWAESRRKVGGLLRQMGEATNGRATSLAECGHIE